MIYSMRFSKAMKVSFSSLCRLSPPIFYVPLKSTESFIASRLARGLSLLAISSSIIWKGDCCAFRGGDCAGETGLADFVAGMLVLNLA